MKLQLAIDEMTIEEGINFVEPLIDYVDIIEIGTPLVIRSGVEKAVKAFKKAYPNTEILADEKIMDGGYFETELGFKSGASYVTVLGVSDKATIAECIRAAKDYNQKIVVDMICVDNMEQRIGELEALDADILAVHTGADQQANGRTPLDDLKEMKKYAKKAKIAVAGGINSETIKTYAALKPDIIIVGSGVTKADNPLEEVKKIKEAMVQ